MPGRTSLRRRGFTLIELLVVLAIIGVLTGLTLAAVQRARESAQRAACMNQVKNQGLAVLHYESAHGRLPPGAVQGPFPALGVPDGVSHGLWPLLLDYLEQSPLARRYRLDRPFDHADNQPVVTARLKVLQCPAADPARVERWEPPRFGSVGDYGPLEVNPFLADLALIDPVDNFDGPLPVNGMVRMAEITDGASHTLLLAEAAARPEVAWSSPLNLIGLRGFFGGSAARHRNGVPVGMADGSVRFLRDGVDVRVLGRLATRAGCEAVGEEF